jgi:phosphatidylserine decarboxylase
MVANVALLPRGGAMKKVKPIESSIPTLGFWGALKLVPQNMVSYGVGKITRIELPAPAQFVVNKTFSKVFNIDLSEAEHPLEHYKSVEEVFCRRLKEGSRDIAGTLISPADGTLERSSPVKERRALQAKGLEYSLAELVFGNETSPESFKWFTTVYLAPHNYHRVHAPVAGTIKKLRYIPGELWPVNKPYVARLPRLFCRNERLVFDIETGHGTVHVVMVGAFNVGRMVTPFLPDFATNDYHSSGAFDVTLSKSQAVAAGDELGTFMLGSTVVLVFDEKATDHFKPRSVENRQSIKMGESLGETV